MKKIISKNLILKDKKSTFIDDTVIIGENVTIYENNRIEGNCHIKDGVVILPGCYIKDTVIGERTIVNSSQCEKSVIGCDCEIGPFARLRPNSNISDKVRIGNFVEVKNSIIGKGSKVSHLAYVGDAEVGKDCNIGCGAIFVNYNGRIKQKIKVGNNCFIGSNCNVIAPVSIEDKAYICAGTTVTENVYTDDFVIGRVRQQTKQNRAHNYLKESSGGK